MKKLKKGDIVFVINEDIAQAGIQNGSRPHLIISNDKFNEFSPVVTCVPLTTRNKRFSPVHYFLHKNAGIEKDSYVLCEQITTIPKSSIKNIICSLPANILLEINTLLSIQLAL